MQKNDTSWTPLLKNFSASAIIIPLLIPSTVAGKKKKMEKVILCWRTEYPTKCGLIHYMQQHYVSVPVILNVELQRLHKDTTRKSSQVAARETYQGYWIVIQILR